MSKISSALNIYRVHTGSFPLESEGLSVLLRDPQSTDGWRGPYLDVSQCCEDAFGEMLIYESDGNEFCLGSSALLRVQNGEKEQWAIGALCRR